MMVLHHGLYNFTVFFLVYILFLNFVLYVNKNNMYM